MDELVKGDFHFFWGGQLSNWHLCHFRVADVWYNSVEQQVMARKALLFDDFDRFDRIMETAAPSEQKKIGRRVKNFDKNKWNRFSREIVYEGCYAKFSQSKELGKYLISTGNKILVEASPYDCIWGIGLNMNDPKAMDPDQWRGKNWLGETLMRVRQSVSHSYTFKESV